MIDMLKRLFEVLVIWPLVVILIPLLIILVILQYIITGDNILLIISGQQKRKIRKRELEKEIENQLN